MTGKKIFTIFFISILLLSHFGNSTISSQQTSSDDIGDNLATTIAKSLSAISSFESSGTYPSQLIFGIETIDNLAETKLRQLDSINATRRIFQFSNFLTPLNYSSSFLNETIKSALARTIMNSYSIPITTNSGFYMWRFGMLNGYKYASMFNVSKELWNASKALKGFQRCRDINDRAFYHCNADAPSVSAKFGTRWMSTANLAQSYLHLFQASNSSLAYNLSLQEWKYLNNNYWSDTRQGYLYSQDWHIWEWSTIEVIFGYEALKRANGSLENWDRIYRDLESRYLNGEWNAPLWRSGLILHSPSSSERRTRGTLDAWLMLHSYFPHFSPTYQDSMKHMLEGDNQILPAWKLILQPDGQVYDPSTHRFKLDSPKGYSGYGTAEGSYLMFLLGLVPLNGSGLQIPRHATGWSGGIHPPKDMRFFYSKQEIVLPIKGPSSFKFLYGNQHPVYNFPSKGIYHIKFDQNWNTIETVNKISSQDVASFPLEPEYNFTSSDTSSETSATSSETSSTSSETSSTSSDTDSKPSETNTSNSTSTSNNSQRTTNSGQDTSTDQQTHSSSSPLDSTTQDTYSTPTHLFRDAMTTETGESNILLLFPIFAVFITTIIFRKNRDVL